MIEKDALFNPTDEQRHELLLNTLTSMGRAEDYEHVLELLSPSEDIYHYGKPLSMKSMRVGIIGGGLAGLTAAYELRKLGAEITIFNADKDRIGGRVHTYYFDRAKRYFGELGALRIPVSHETTWHYINLFHLNTETLSAPAPNNFIYAHGIRIRRDPNGEQVAANFYPLYDLTAAERQYPWPQLVASATNTAFYSLSPEIRTEILKILPEYHKEYADLTRLSIRQVFELLGLSQGAINLISALEPFTAATLSNSYSNLMSSIYSLDFMNVYRIKGGMINLPLAFYKSLTDNDPPDQNMPTYFLGNVQFKAGAAVNGIFYSTNTRKVILRHSFGGKNLTDTFDYVICAIPYSTLREIEIAPFFSDQKMQAIRELNYIDSQKTLFLCKKRFWEEDTHYGRINGGTSFTDQIIQSIVYPPDHLYGVHPEGYHEPGVLTASYNIGQDAGRLSNQGKHRRFNVIKSDVERVHGMAPGLLDSYISSHQTMHWNDEPWARGAFAFPNPGQKINLAYAMQQPEYENRIFFAGEHISNKQGWIQGALSTGRTAANSVAKEVKKLNKF